MNSKAGLFVVFLIFARFVSLGQTGSVLFVNDNGVYPPNTDTMKVALNHSVAPLYDVFNARDSMRAPDYPEIMNYELIIWYCSSDGAGNYFWDGNDTICDALKQYLDNGGKLWVMGTDLLYDRYSTPKIFGLNDFVYHYMGVSEYHAQAYGDDGGQGVAQLNPESFLSGQPSIHWIYSTAWWVDACVNAPTGTGLYKMGPAGYMFDSYYSGFLVNSTFKTVFFCFDPAIIDTYSNRLQMTNAVLSWLLNLTAVPENESLTSISIYPNPLMNTAIVTVNQPYKQDQYLQVTDLAGKIVFVENSPSSVNDSNTSWTVNLTLVPAGMYFCKLVNSETKQVVRLLKID